MELLEQITHLADTLAYLFTTFMFLGVFILSLSLTYIVFSILEDKGDK